MPSNVHTVYIAGCRLFKDDISGREFITHSLHSLLMQKGIVEDIIFKKYLYNIPSATINLLLKVINLHQCIIPRITLPFPLRLPLLVGRRPAPAWQLIAAHANGQLGPCLLWPSINLEAHWRVDYWPHLSGSAAGLGRVLGVTTPGSILRVTTTRACVKGGDSACSWGCHPKDGSSKN